MKKDSHELRRTLAELNKSMVHLFKIDNDPRILQGLDFARSISLDELTQFINVFKEICQLLDQDHYLMMILKFLYKIYEKIKCLARNYWATSN